MAGVAAELEDVPLRDAQVLQETPGRVRRPLYLGAAQLHGQIRDGILEAQVGPLTTQQIKQVLTQGLVVFHRSLLCSLGDRLRKLPGASGELPGASGEPAT